MYTLMLSLLIFSLVLFLFSFFQKDPHKELKEELEQFSIQQMQEVYQIKKKLKILEEELLMNEVIMPESVSAHTPSKDIHEIIKNQVIALSQQGKSLDQIAFQSSLTMEDVFQILNEADKRGMGNE